MSLRIGQIVHAEMMNVNLTIKKKLGEGGQGAVYLVEGSQGQQALKWYNAEQSTEEQKKAIRDLVQAGPPRGHSGRRFIWPLDLVTASDSKQFGYLMPLINKRKFAELPEVWSRTKPAPSYAALCEISYELANSYRALHLEGYCYRDISAGNIMFDPKTGDVLICDNDNIGINRQSKCQIWGTWEYMAPEIVRGEAQPSTDTDLHSLGVLLYYLWIWHHPLHGEMEYRIRSWDIPAKKLVYGQNPVFTFHPMDPSNRLPNDPDYSTAGRRWEDCPKSLKELFARAFTVGLKDPSRRVTEGEWQALFLQLKDCVIACPHDRAENIWEPGMASLNCWHCKNQIYVPPKLVFAHVRGRHYLLLTNETKIMKRHVDPLASEAEEMSLIGQVVQNPSNPQVWGIRNMTQNPWTATFADGSTKEIASQKAVTLTPGTKLNIAGAVAEIFG
jgi:DNA-binding helix-hairpin-helix protein with protein kinase domain